MQSPQIGHKQTLRAQFWIKSLKIDIDKLAEKEKARGNTVIEVHKACNCRGAGSNEYDNGKDRDDHLLVLNAERVI